MKKLTIGIITTLALCVGVGAHAEMYYPAPRTLTVSTITQTSATVQVSGDISFVNYGPVLSVEYQYDMCATNLRQYGSNVCPAIYVMPQKVTLSTTGSYTLTGLLPNSVYKARYVLDQRPIDGGLEEGPWISFATPGQTVIQFPTFPPVTAALDLGPTTLRQGSSGQYVMNLQILLNNHMNAGLTPDGKFGLRTKTSVMAFQSSKNLYPDGLVGTVTKQALYSLSDTNNPSYPTQPTNTQISISNADNGKTITLGQGQTLSVTLGNPGDAGYQYDFPLFDANVLRYINQTTNPNWTGAIGNWGTITWTFQAQNSGSTTLNYTMSRPWTGGEKNVQAFRTQIIVQ